MKKRKLFIGTSGWVYSHWEGIFYPEGLPSKDKLKYFSQHFKTVEINYSFYRLPRPSTYQNWYNQTTSDFLFAVKASRFITHIKRLKEVKEAWKVFRENALNLKEKLGPILFQFPPSFKATEENIKRLGDFLKFITCPQFQRSLISATRISFQKNDKKRLRFAFEFRHESWCDKKIYNLLKKYNAAWVIVCPPIGWSLPPDFACERTRWRTGKTTGRRADSPKYPKTEEITANFVYIRLHGSKILFSSKYTKKELQDLAKKIKKWLKVGDVYAYFNNDAYGHAIKNAKELRKLCLPR